MKLRNGLILFAIFALSGATARADLGYWSANLVGTWKHPTNGDMYRFNSDATYTFTRKNRKSDGVIAHEGWWKIYDAGRKVSGPHGPVGLRLKARSRVVMRKGKKHTLKTNRVFELLVNTPFGVEGDPSENGKYYWIDGVKWLRVR